MSIQNKMEKYSVKIKEDIWIEMSDGVKLSAKIWFPILRDSQPLPAILEFIPYRKGDASSMRDFVIHHFFAENGYVSIRPDMRGHGDSEGIMEDEYSLRERKDAVEIINWIEKQEWSNGKVGMTGISWGGIASLQAAINRPKALKAIIPVGASVDRYYDDGAYLVGGYPGQGLGWGAVMFHYCARPPDFDIVGDRWKDMWRDRIEKTPLYAEKWLSHQLRDETWINGSICEDYDKINIPVLAISGWYDCWPNTVIRLLENLSSPVKAISGSWAHVYPHLNDVDHSDSFLNQALIWWNYWLKDNKSINVLKEPAFKAYIQESHLPNPNETIKNGYWVEEETWPSENISLQQFDLLFDLDNNTDNNYAVINSPLSLGLNSGEYMPISGFAEYPQNQKEDDAKSVCFESKVLENDIEILGTSYVNLRLKSNKDLGLIVARFCDVAPDGTSCLISYGLLNLKLRHGKDKCAPVQPEDFMDITIRMNDTGWRVKKGQKLRLALSTNMWPMAWPMAKDFLITIDKTASNLQIPSRNSKNTESFKKPSLKIKNKILTQINHQVKKEPSANRYISKDPGSNEIHYHVSHDGGKVNFLDKKLDFQAKNSQDYYIKDGNSLSAKITYKAEFFLQRNDWLVQSKSFLTVKCDEKYFYLKGNIKTYEGKHLFMEKKWNTRIKRDIY